LVFIQIQTLPLSMPRSGKKPLILYGKQPMVYYRGPTPNEKFHRVQE
jgi:hypothetical protein